MATRRLEVAITARLELDDRTKNALIALGWTPPTEPDATEDEPPCPTFSEHGWGRCVEPHGHTGQHMYRTPTATKGTLSP